MGDVESNLSPSTRWKFVSHQLARGVGCGEKVTVVATLKRDKKHGKGIGRMIKIANLMG